MASGRRASNHRPGAQCGFVEHLLPFAPVARATPSWECLRCRKKGVYMLSVVCDRAVAWRRFDWARAFLDCGIFPIPGAEWGLRWRPQTSQLEMLRIVRSTLTAWHMDCQLGLPSPGYIQHASQRSGDEAFEALSRIQAHYYCPLPKGQRSPSLTRRPSPHSSHHSTYIAVHMC